MNIQPTRLTAMEIFANPRDLAITVFQQYQSDKFGLFFMRGPGHNFKLLFTVTNIPMREDAFKIVFQILDATLRECEGARTNHDLCLDREMVNRIMLTLEESSTANTYEFAAA